MAGSIVQIVGPGGAATSATSIVSSSITVTAGNQLWVIAISDDATITSISDSWSSGANTYTERGSVIEAAILRRLHHATCQITTGGTGTVTVNLGASVANRQVWLVEVTGVGAYDAQGTATDTGNNPTTAASATNSAQPAFCIAAIVDYQGGTPAVNQISGSAATSGGTLAAGGQLGGLVEYRSVTTVTSQTANFTNAGFNRTCTVFAVFLEDSAPTISAQPTDQTANDGATATFSVTATGGTAPYTYQWQDNSSGSFANIGGATSSSYSPTASFAIQGRQYRCVVTGANSLSVTSNAATLRVAFKTSGTGPRSVPLLGHPFGAGSSESYIRGTASGSPDVTLSVTGVSATGQVGTVKSAIDKSLTGNQATGQVGTVTSAVSYALTGNQATGQLGTVVSSITYALTGVQATGAVGTVTVAATDVTLALTGVSATGSVGTLAANVAYAITGAQGSGQVGTAVPAVSYALTGVQATGNVGAVVANVDYALTGVSATGQVGNVTTGNDVTLSLTGVQATGAVGNLLANLSYSLTGNQASGQVGNLVASPTYGLTGVQATGQVGNIGDSISYTLTGVQATGDVGNLAVPGDVTKALTGVEAIGQVGSVTATQPAIFVKGGDADKPRKKHRNHRREVRESLLRIFNGPEEIKEQAKAILRPFTKFAEVTPETVDIERLRSDLEAVSRLVELAQEDEDEEAILLML